jgi:hypothetical protein
MEVRTINRGARLGLLAGTVIAVVGCSQGRYEPILSTAAPAPAAKRWEFTPVDAKYYGDQSPAWNFQHVLENSAYECGQQAEMGHILYRQLREYGSSKRPDDNAQALADCQQHARQRGNEAIARLKQTKVSTKVLELSKELYGKWSVYMSGMTIYSSKNTLAATQYETSRRALLAEDKFSQ